MSSRTSKKQSKQPTSAIKSAVLPQDTGKSISPRNPVIEKAFGLIQKDDYAAAANLLSSAGRETQVRNMLGVCLMRLGRVDLAAEVFRSFVLMPGTVVERPEISNACKRNFATALLMNGSPSGALTVLAEIREPEHPMQIKIQSAINRWSDSLPWLRWIDWKLNHIEPANCHVSLDFAPGEFEWSDQIHKPTEPLKPDGSVLKTAA